MKAAIIAKGQLKNKTKQGLPVQETQSATGPSLKEQHQIRTPAYSKSQNFPYPIEFLGKFTLKESLISDGLIRDFFQWLLTKKDYL